MLEKVLFVNHLELNRRGVVALSSGRRRERSSARRRISNRGITLHWVVVFTLFAAASPAGTRAEDEGLKERKPIPALSLKSLYHPKEKYDFDGSLPATHWIGDSPSQLLIRREQTWNEVDLQSGKESKWPIVDRLIHQLEQLDGMKEGQAKSTAIAAVSNMKTATDTLLVRIGNALAIVSPEQPARLLTRNAKAWRNAKLDPTARRVAYTQNGDLHVVDVKSGRSLPLTNDGTDTLLDGVLDWTYQEEIFGRGNFRGFWFSADGNWLAMLRIDISDIEPYVLSSSAANRGQGKVSRYPKAGDPIPQAELLVWDLSGLDSGTLPPPKSIAKSTPRQERIVTGVWWCPTRLQLLFSISDRLQTWRELRSIGEPFLTGAERESRLMIREESPAWVEPPAEPTWLADGSLVWQSNLPTGRSRLFHITVSRSSRDRQIVTPLSPTDFDVHNFRVSSDGAHVLVTGGGRTSIAERHVYRIDVSEMVHPSDKQSLSGPSGAPLNELIRVNELIQITEQSGWHSATFSPDGNWFVDQSSTPSQPPQLLLQSSEGGNKRVLAKSEFKLLSKRVVPDVFQITTADQLKLPAMLVRPRSASRDHPCPVVIEVYGGPRAPSVSTRWSGTKSLYRELLAREGIATLVVDNRSSAGRGIADTWSIRGKVGEIEMRDLMSSVDWLKQQPWVDSGRLAIRGWSFGGFLTLYAMTHSDAFAAGIAGGSVTDWSEYDAFYTERYMGLPVENKEGYQSTAPVLMAHQMSGRVLMIHGESDDNVHPSGTLRMASALQKAGKDFRLMIYPGAAHAIREKHQAWHMAQMTYRFLLEELLGRGSDSADNR